MSRKKKFTVYEKLNAIEDYLSGRKGIRQICREMKVLIYNEYWVLP